MLKSLMFVALVASVFFLVSGDETSCAGDPNAQSGCDLNCGKRCPANKQDYCREKTECPSDFCECKDGYIFDKKTFKCVLPSECN